MRLPERSAPPGGRVEAQRNLILIGGAGASETRLSTLLIPVSNFVFSRRALQAALDRLAGVADAHQAASLVDRLNRPGQDCLPAMWDVVVLDGLAQVGVLRHEVELPDGRRPDFKMTLDGPSTSAVVVGDVRAVSGAGLDEQNPVEALSDELIRTGHQAALTLQDGRADLVALGREPLWNPNWPGQTAGAHMARLHRRYAAQRRRQASGMSGCFRDTAPSGRLIQKEWWVQ